MINRWFQWYDNFDRQHVFLGIAGKVLDIVIFYVAAKILVRILIATANRVILSSNVRMEERRKNTLLSLVDNVIRYTIYFLFLVEALAQMNVHIETILAGAGIAGLALGFGAQSLIKDLLTGFFILFEDQYGVGDTVKINNFTGTVKSIGLRLTRIQAWTGEIEIIPNGQITQVTNYSRENSIAVIDIGVSYSADLTKATNVIVRTMETVKQENDNIIGDVQVLGVQSLGQSNVVLRVTAVCKPTTQYGVQRLANQRIKEALDKAGIEIPFPQTVVWMNPSANKAQ